ncbi:MAG: tol-pal system protein YbgF [Parvibaculum sp.]|uniref:tol-pal system protein YbgF n=1 Tax=Parvibaculum sp. TaxID=2024848 RepID=UPI0034A035FA
MRYALEVRLHPGFRRKHGVLWTIAASALAGLSLLAADAAVAQSGGDVDMRAIGNRLDRIEREITDLQRQSYGSGASTGVPTPLGSGAGAADAQSRIFELEEQVRRLNGTLEEMGHRVEQMNRDLQLFKADTDMRFQDAQGGSAATAPGGATSPADDEGETGGGPASAEGSLGVAPAASTPAATVLPNGTPQVQYDFAIDLMKRGQYDQARAAFIEFLQLHPKDTLAGNAQYWLGETYYAQNRHKEAGDAFLTGYTTYSSSNKAPDSLLKLGMSLAALGNKDAACTVWSELGSRFPQASPAVVARNKLEREKAGC